jgi:hypothetical protein
MADTGSSRFESHVDRSGDHHVWLGSRNPQRRTGQARVAEATGMSRNTLLVGAKELADGPVLQARVRRPGAGLKRKVDLDPDLLVVLDSLVEPESLGDPMSPLRWTAKSTRALRPS